jgi:hypothetical protein
MGSFEEDEKDMFLVYKRDYTIVGEVMMNVKLKE